MSSRGDHWEEVLKKMEEASLSRNYRVICSPRHVDECQHSDYGDASL